MIHLNNLSAEIFIPDGTDIEDALARTTHLAIGAHQDDLEIMAYDGIVQCFGKKNKGFFGIIVTDGRGSSRSNQYSDFTDEQMRNIRNSEQKKAAIIGEYTGIALLDYSSSDVKKPNNSGLIHDLINLITLAQPEIVYTHNLADKHETHVAVAVKVIQSIRQLSQKPRKLYGCEIWRSLDWMRDAEKVVFDVDSSPNIAAALLEVFDSQITGGKRYDKATLGRRFSNATYFSSHTSDASQALIFAMDLSPLIENSNLDIIQFISDYLQHFSIDIISNLTKMLPTEDYHKN